MVVAIIGTLCAVLFPVISVAKSASRRVGCATNLRQLSVGALAYATDYDERLMPINHQPAAEATSRNDRTWVQLVLPYTRSFAVFHCPADATDRPRPESTFDQDLVPGDTDSQYYTASLRSDYAYNYQNLAPILQGFDGQWAARPHQISEVATTSSTLLFIDSAWERDDQGNPRGGGNWLVVPPCRYYAKTHIDSFTGVVGGRIPVFTTAYGWGNASASTGAMGTMGYDDHTAPPGQVYGNAWPWHDGFMNYVALDTSVHAVRPPQLGAGCDVRDAWQGEIDDAGRYVWDVR